MRLLLEAAGRTQDAEVLEELAREIVACLLADPAPAAAAWQAAHAQQLPGSSAVLQSLAASFPWQLQPPHAMGALRSTLTPLLQVIIPSTVYPALSHSVLPLQLQPFPKPALGYHFHRSWLHTFLGFSYRIT